MPGLMLTYMWLVAAVGVSADPASAVSAPAADLVSVEGDRVAVTDPGAAAPDAAAPDGPVAAEVSEDRAAPEAVVPEAVDPVSAAPQEPAEILRRTAAAYEGMESVSADFTQIMRNTLLGRTTESAGTLYQREPDKFLMDFSQPEGDLIVSDGRYFWMYFPSVDEKQVIRTPRRGQGLDLKAQFIGDPVERFEYTYHGTETFRGREAHVLTLDPREEAGYQRMKVWIDGEDWLVRRFELHEENGNVRHMELRNLVVNPELPDVLFEFTPPEGAIVVERG